MKTTLSKLFMSIVVLFFVLIPTWTFIDVRSPLSLEGFFQNFFVFEIGTWLWGGTQIALLVVYSLACLPFIWRK